MGVRDSAQKILEAFGERLREERRRQGLTQDELAARAECSSVTLSKLERGENLPTFDILLSLSIALGTSPNALVGWPENADSAPSLPRKMDGLVAMAKSLPDEWIDLLTQVAERANERPRR